MTSGEFERIVRSRAARIAVGPSTVRGRGNNSDEEDQGTDSDQGSVMPAPDYAVTGLVRLPAGAPWPSLADWPSGWASQPRDRPPSGPKT